MPRFESTWDDRGPIKVMSWGYNENNERHYYTVAAILIAVNGDVVAYDLRIPDQPKYIGRFPAGGDDWKEKIRSAGDAVDRYLASERERAKLQPTNERPEERQHKSETVGA